MSVKVFLFLMWTSVATVLSVIIGKFTSNLVILLGVIILDYLTGLIVGGVFHNSPKTINGRLESNASLKGILRKVFYFVMVIIANYLDVISGSNFVRETVIIILIINDTLSITENIGLMGVPIPSVITNAIAVLKEKSGDK